MGKSRRMTAIAGAAAALAAATGPAYAVDIEEIRGGVLIHDLGPFSTQKEDGLDIHGELVFASPRALSFLLRPRPHVGVYVATDGEAASYVYAGLGWRQDIARRLYIEGGFGFALHDGETDFEPGDPFFTDRAYLGCRVLARVSGDLGYRVTDRLSASLHVSHLSNANVCDDNEGVDSTGVRLGWKF